MKIAVIAASRVPSETANSIQLMKVCQAMRQIGHTVTLLVPGAGARGPESHWPALASHYGLSAPFEIEWLPARSRRLFTLRAALRARALRADLIYTWVIQSAFFGLLLGRPVVFEAHELPSGRLGPWWYRRFVSAPGRKRIAFITRGLRSMLEERYGRVAEDQAVIAPMGVELERYPRDAGDPAPFRRALGLPDRPTVMCTGHLYAGRGVELFAALARSIPEAAFVWVGGRAEDVAAWRERAAGTGNLTFTGFIPNAELPRYQAAADALLMPYGRSISGSSGGDTAAGASPMKMFEYMAAGRAIVASDLPVLREVLSDESAVFCPPDDARVWEAALRALLSDPDRRARLGARSRAEAQKYSWTGRAKAILADLC